MCSFYQKIKSFSRNFPADSDLYLNGQPNSKETEKVFPASVRESRQGRENWNGFCPASATELKEPLSKNSGTLEKSNTIYQ